MILDPDYARIFTQARIVAWQYGYACVAHGSFTRDLDLLLVPWEERAAKIDAELVVKRIAGVAGLSLQGPPNDKPLGRKAWSLLLPGFSEVRWVDVSAFVPNEVERLNSPVVLSEWQKLVAERDALMSLIRDEIDENTRLRVLGGAAAGEGITAMIERVIAERGSFEALWRSTMDVLEAERAERDALARDAARYRWLRQPNPLHREAHIAVLTHNGGWVASEEKADAAIDAAMKGAGDE